LTRASAFRYDELLTAARANISARPIPAFHFPPCIIAANAKLKSIRDGALPALRRGFDCTHRGRGSACGETVPAKDSAAWGVLLGVLLAAIWSFLWFVVPERKAIHHAGEARAVESLRPGAVRPGGLRQRHSGEPTAGVRGAG